MTTPRRDLVDPNQPLFYHLVSRCVRRAWLCGYDRTARRDYTHRKQWLIERLHTLGQAFAVDTYAYSIMNNHFHLVVYYDPKAPDRWSDLEVVERWLRVCPPKLPDGSIDEGLRALRKATMLDNPELLAALRLKLGSLSCFMKCLKQPIARRANLEDQCTGHFFEQRFYSGALLTNAAVLAAMAYVDLNPVRAKVARSIAEAEHTSILARSVSTNALDALQAYLEPVVSGLDQGSVVPVLLGTYLEYLEALYSTPPSHWSPSKLKRWRDQVATLGKHQRVFGSYDKIKAWVEQRGWQMREVSLP